MIRLENIEQAANEYRAYSSSLASARLALSDALYRLQSCGDHGVITQLEVANSLAFIETLMGQVDHGSMEGLADIVCSACAEKKRLRDLEVSFIHKYGVWTYLPEEEKASLSAKEKAEMLQLEELRLVDVASTDSVVVH